MTRYLLPLAVLVLAFLAFRYLTSGGDTQPVETVAQAIADGAQVLDVRTSDEYASGHVVGAVHANVLDPGFAGAVSGLNASEPVYVYCASGHRSGRAASKLEALGFEIVINAGGIGDLSAAGVPTER